MNEAEGQQDVARPNQDQQIEYLIERLAEAEKAVQTLLTDQLDTVADPVTAVPILLRDTQKALRASEERYRLLVAHMSACVFELEPDGAIVFVNQAMSDHTGYKMDELYGRNWWQVFFPAAEQAQAERLKRHFQQDDVNNYEVTLTTKNGQPLLLELSSANRYSDDGRLERIVGVGIDIGARHRANAALRTSERRYRSLVETSPDAIFYLGLDKEIRLANRQAAELYGFASGEAMSGLPFLSLVAHYHQDYLASQLARVAPGWHFAGDCHMVREDGSEFPAEVAASAVEDERGKPVAITFIVRDATMRQRMEQYVRRTERLAAMGQMAAVLAHEIRNPLQAIQSSVELVVDYLVDPAEREEYLRHSYKEVERLTEITNRVLNFSDPETITFYHIAVTELLQRALALVDRRLPPANIHLTRDVPENLPSLYVAPDQIVQVLVNLFLNAIESMPEGGQMDIKAWQKNDSVYIAVTNSGPPIPPALIDRIFDPFFSTKSTGAGLGLTISDSIVQQHGGVLSVQNRAANQGVTFTIALPIAPFKKYVREARE
jgi:two-component system, sporulation sensor kinase A